MATSPAVVNGALPKVTRGPLLPMLPATRPEKETQKRVTIRRTGQLDPCIRVLGAPQPPVLVEIKGTSETPIGLTKATLHVAQEAYERLVSAGIGVEVDPPQARYEIALRHESDTGYARQGVAKRVLWVLGHGVLTEDYQITLNGTPLSPELLDEALAPTVVYKV